MKNDNFDFKFYEWEEKFHDRPFLKQPFGDQWETYTWGEVGQMARKLATGLQSLGLREKAHIGLISKNCREWIIADLAILMAGHISVPFFPNLSSDEINNLVTFGEVDILIVGKIETWDELQKGIPDSIPIIAFPTYKGHSNINKGYQWLDFINQFEPLKTPHVPKLSDTWTIVFTSGTTGSPKGVVLDFLSNDNTKVLTQGSNPLKINFSGNNDFYSYLPLNHIAERMVVEFTCFRYGGTISFVESFDTFSENLQEVQPTVFFAVPRIWTKFQMGILAKISQEKLNILLKIPIISGILKKKFKKALGLSRARATVSGAAPMQESQREWFYKLGIKITNGYGMTENCAVCTQLDGEITNKKGSVGIPHSQRKPSRESPASVRVFRNTTCTPTAPPPQQNSHICAHAPGQAVKLTNSTGCSNLTGTGFPYPQSTPIAPTRRLPLPTHLSPPLPAQNSHICTHARTWSSGQTNKQHRLHTQKHRLPLRSWPAKAGSQAVVHRRGCAPVATTSTRQRRTIASAHHAHGSGGQTQKHRLPLHSWPAKAGSQAPASPTRVGHPRPHTRTGCPNAPCPSTCTCTWYCWFLLSERTDVFACTHHLQSQNLSNVGFG